MNYGAKSGGHRVTLGALRSMLCNPRLSPGFAYIALLVAIIIIGISMGAAGKYWSNVMLREKEEEMLFRGEQYRKAIDSYASVPGRIREFPSSIDDLLKDSRSAAGRRHLRQQYKDPMTGDDFDEIQHPATKRIIGVRSKSDKESLKQANFPPTVLVPDSTGTYSVPVLVPPRAPHSIDEETAVSDKIKYNDWLFYTSMSTTAQQPNVPGKPYVQGQPNFPVQPPGQIPGQLPGQLPGGNRIPGLRQQ